MSYIGAEPTTAAFPFDQFSGNGSTTAFTLTYAPASTTSIIVAISGVMQNPNLYSVVGTTLTFSPAPPTGTNNISVLYLGLPVIGSSSPGNTAFLSSTDLTATAGQTVFASAGSYTPGFVQVYRNGARLGNADFTATNGTTITLANAATAGDLVTIEYYTLTSLTNALPLTGGTVTGSTTFNTGVNLAAVSGNVGIGTTSPAVTLDIRSTAAAASRFSRSGTSGQLTSIVFEDGSATLGSANTTRIASSTGYLAFSTGGTSGDTAGGTEQARLTAAGLLQFNSGYGSVATAYGCRAWVNFNGTGTVAIRASGNVSSITDNGTGDYTINFTTAMPDANYSASMQILQNASRVFTVNGLAAGSLRIICRQLTENPSDNEFITATVFR